MTIFRVYDIRGEAHDYQGDCVALDPDKNMIGIQRLDHISSLDGQPIVHSVALFGPGMWICYEVIPAEESVH